MKNFELIILSMPKSPRLFFLKKRLKKLNINNYKIFFGNPGNTRNQRKIIYSHYNKKKAENFIGRKMTFNEIGAEFTTIRVYNYIVKNKIQNAIVMHDDVYPSKLFKKWIDSKIYLSGLKIIGFFCSQTGFLRKTPDYKLLKGRRICLHQAKTHIFISQCMQINFDFCKYYLSIVKNKVCGQNDFAFNFKKAGIKIFQTIPYLVYPDDKGVSFLRDERHKAERPFFSIKFKQKISKYSLVRSLLNLLRIFFYISCAPYLFRKYSYSYYKEYFFDKYKISFVNFFLRKYLDVNTIYVMNNNYPKELTKFIKHFY